MRIFLLLVRIRVGNLRETFPTSWIQQGTHSYRLLRLTRPRRILYRQEPFQVPSRKPPGEPWLLEVGRDAGSVIRSHTALTTNRRHHVNRTILRKAQFGHYIIKSLDDQKTESNPSKTTAYRLNTVTLSVTMCVAGLNVSTQPCNHRWYHLVRSCDATTNLANCPERLRLEGWESRVDICPFCNGDERAGDQSTHRLFGRTSFSSSVVPLSSLAPTEIGAPVRYHRRGSTATTSTLSRQSSLDSEAEIDRGRMHRLRNDRLLLYLTSDPHEVLPSAKKNYPTYSSFPASSPCAENASEPAQSSVSGSSAFANSGRTFARGWKKSIQLGKGLFKS